MGPAVWRRDPRPSAAGEATAYRGRERERKNSRDGGREKEFWSLDARRAINKRRANKSKMIDSRPAAKKKNLFALHLLPPPPSLSLSLSLSLRFFPPPTGRLCVGSADDVRHDHPRADRGQDRRPRPRRRARAGDRLLPVFHGDSDDARPRRAHWDRRGHGCTSERRGRSS